MTQSGSVFIFFHLTWISCILCESCGQSRLWIAIISSFRRYPTISSPHTGTQQRAKVLENRSNSGGSAWTLTFGSPWYGARTDFKRIDFRLATNLEGWVRSTPRATSKSSTSRKRSLCASLPSSCTTRGSEVSSPKACNSLSSNARPRSTISSRRWIDNQCRIRLIAWGVLTCPNQSNIGPHSDPPVMISTWSSNCNCWYRSPRAPFTSTSTQWWPTSVWML